MTKNINFTKMHGTGNDYIYINCFDENFTADDAKKYAPIFSNRNFSIGSDGIILIMPSDIAHAKMRMFNADGSEAEMCGNGIRCVAKYIYDKKIACNNPLNIETGRGILEVELETENDIVKYATVNMGSPILEGLKIPTTIDKKTIINEPIKIDGITYHFTSVSMGNPHAVIYVENLKEFDVKNVGSKIEVHPYFPNRVVVEFVEIISKNEVNQRTWERGSGETLSCGTGASAVCVAGFISGRTSNSITTNLLGGSLKLKYDEIKNSVFMRGDAHYSFHGNIII